MTLNVEMLDNHLLQLFSESNLAHFACENNFMILKSEMVRIIAAISKSSLDIKIKTFNHIHSFIFNNLLNKTIKHSIAFITSANALLMALSYIKAEIAKMKFKSDPDLDRFFGSEYLLTRVMHVTYLTFIEACEAGGYPSITILSNSLDFLRNDLMLIDDCFASIATVASSVANQDTAFIRMLYALSVSNTRAPLPGFFRFILEKIEEIIIRKVYSPTVEYMVHRTCIYSEVRIAFETKLLTFDEKRELTLKLFTDLGPIIVQKNMHMFGVAIKDSMSGPEASAALDALIKFTRRKKN